MGQGLEAITMGVAITVGLIYLGSYGLGKLYDFVCKNSSDKPDKKNR